MDPKSHWEGIYQENNPDEVSWFQPKLAISLELIKSVEPRKDARIIDIGGGASTLMESLLADGYKNLSVLDISGNALAKIKERLKENASKIEWFETSILDFSNPGKFDLWHDRAVFHFLVSGNDRATYLKNLTRSLKPNGHFIVATFAIDGPLKCSGLDVVRYDEASMKSEVGKGFELVKSCHELHKTPWNAEQKFTYFLFKRVTPSA